MLPDLSGTCRPQVGEGWRSPRGNRRLASRRAPAATLHWPGHPADDQPLPTRTDRFPRLPRDGRDSPRRARTPHARNPRPSRPHRDRTGLVKISVHEPENQAYSPPTKFDSHMPDAHKIRNRVLLRLAGHPLVIGPFIAGMTALTAAWSLGWKAGFALFAGLAGVLAAAGSLVTQLTLRGEKLATQVTEEVAREEREAAQRLLDDLDQQLAEADKDPRPETALRDLRALVRAFDEAEAASSPAHLPLVVDLRARVQEVFHQGVEAVAQTGKLWQTARQLNSPAARQPLLDQRERLIADVQATVKQLSDTLVGVQSLGTGEGSPRELTRLREELDQSLAVARTVEERVASLLNETSVGSRQSLAATTSETKG